jgi:hypothetical protein
VAQPASASADAARSRVAGLRTVQGQLMTWKPRSFTSPAR